jgi:uncharacterized protein
MYVGLAKLQLAIPAARSLKDKRMVIRRVKDRVRERLGVTVSEVGELEIWQRAELGCAVTSGDRRKALALIDEVIREVARVADGQIVAVAKDAWTFDSAPAPVAVAVDDRTGSGDKAAADTSWVPDAWRDDADP